MLRYTIAFIAIVALTAFGTVAHAQDTTLAVTADGKVGIGTANPEATLEIKGTSLIRAGDFKGNAGGASGGLEIRGPAGTYGPSLALDNGTQQWNMVSWEDNSFRIVKSTGTTFSPLIIKNNSFQNALVLTSQGVGVGTSNPTEKLSVAGTIESTSGGFKFPDGTVQNTAAVNLHIQALAGERLADAGNKNEASILVAINSATGPVRGLQMSNFQVKAVLVAPFGCDVTLKRVIEPSPGAYLLDIVPYEQNAACQWRKGQYLLSILVDTPQGKVVGITELFVDTTN